MNTDFIPAMTAIPQLDRLYFKNLSETITTDVLLLFLQKSAHQTTFVALSEPTAWADSEHLLVMSDDLETTETFFKANPHLSQAHVLLTESLFMPTPSQKLLAQTDWYVIREMERKLFPDGHPFRVFRDGLRDGDE